MRTITLEVDDTDYDTIQKEFQESPEDDEYQKEITHIYHLESGKYVYKGVRK